MFGAEQSLVTLFARCAAPPQTGSFTNWPSHQQKPWALQNDQMSAAKPSIMGWWEKVYGELVQKQIAQTIFIAGSFTIRQNCNKTVRLTIIEWRMSAKFLWIIKSQFYKNPTALAIALVQIFNAWKSDIFEKQTIGR